MTEKIIRNGLKAKGGVTPEELVQMKKISEKWIRTAYRTEPIDNDKITVAIKKLYEVSGLKEPRVVIVPSPLVMALAYGLSATIWQLRRRKNIATRDATDYATDYATDTATDTTTNTATNNATNTKTDTATWNATSNATEKATQNLIDNYSWFSVMAEQLVGKDNISLVMDNVKKWYINYQGGNMWASSCSYYEACREVLKLTKLDCWDKYQAWEDCAKEGGFRVMHEEFCLVCDFPEKLQATPDGVPHCESGPSHKWRDGFSIYHLNGVKVPAWVVETPAEEIPIKLALEEKNTDVQREIIRKIGAERMLKESNAKILDEFIDKTGFKYQLMSMTIGSTINRKYLYFEHASMRGVWYAKPVPPETQKALHGRAWILSMIEREDLSKIDDKIEKQLIKNLPKYVS